MLKTFFISRLLLFSSWSIWVKASTALAVLAILFLIFGTAFWEAFRDWLIANESGSTTIRNLGLVLAGLIALPLAIWRGLVAEKQAHAAQQGLRNERYQKGAEMLGSKHLSVRLAAIYALQRLAKEYSGEYHLQILRILSAFVRHPVADGAHVEEVAAKVGRPHIREDVQAAIGVINKRIVETMKVESTDMSYLDLSGTDLMYGDLREANLKGATLREANLSDANLSGAHLSGVIGLTQTQLDQARAEPDNPPMLLNDLDAKTGKPLVWTGGRGAPL